MFPGFGVWFLVQLLSSLTSQKRQARLALPWAELESTRCKLKQQRGRQLHGVVAALRAGVVSVLFVARVCAACTAAACKRGSVLVSSLGVTSSFQQQVTAREPTSGGGSGQHSILPSCNKTGGHRQQSAAASLTQTAQQAHHSY